MSEERLDEETERRVMDVMLGGYNSVSELRSRIRTLVDEARKQGEESVYRNHGQHGKAFVMSLSVRPQVDTVNRIEE